MKQVDEVQCKCYFDGFRSATEAGGETYPMKWVDTDKNEYPRRDNDHVSVPAKYRESISWLRKTSRQQKDFAQILQLVI